MPIGSRDDRLSQANGIGKRARANLRLVKIGRDIDIAGCEQLQQIGQIDIAIDKMEMAGYAELVRQFAKTVAIALPLARA